MSKSSVYVLHHHSASCTTCGASHSWSHLYLAEGVSHNSIKLKPVDTFAGDPADLEVVHLTQKPLAVCHHCLGWLPASPRRERDAARASWADTLKKKAAQATQEAHAVEKINHNTRPIEDLA